MPEEAELCEEEYGSPRETARDDVSSCSESDYRALLGSPLRAAQDGAAPVSCVAFEYTFRSENFACVMLLCFASASDKVSCLACIPHLPLLICNIIRSCNAIVLNCQQNEQSVSKRRHLRESDKPQGSQKEV